MFDGAVSLATYRKHSLGFRSRICPDFLGLFQEILAELRLKRIKLLVFLITMLKLLIFSVSGYQQFYTSTLFCLTQVTQQGWIFLQVCVSLQM